jgi:hypothetical protein
MIPSFAKSIATATLLAAGALSLAACGGGSSAPPERVFAHCVRAPNLDAGVSLGELVAFLQERGRDNAWKSDGDNLILQSSSVDPLTNAASNLTFEILIRSQDSSDARFEGCDAGRAVITRILTPGGIAHGVSVDMIIARMADEIGARKAITNPEAPPVVDQVAAGATFDAAEGPRPAPTIKPSFDCRRASSKVESLICSSEGLARLDSEMTKLYGQVRDVNPNATADQSSWLSQRNRCATISCVQSLYEERAAYFQDRLREAQYGPSRIG